MPRPTKFDRQRAALPVPGTAFLMPLQDGRLGVCRVLRHSTDTEAAQQGAVQALVAMPPWIGSEVPDLADPQLREIQVLTHHAFKNEPCVLWVGGAPPEGFRHFGNIEPTPEDSERMGGSSSAWAWFPLQLLMQWEWDTNRAEVLQKDQAERERTEAANRNAAEDYRRYLDTLTLEGLLLRPRFEGWKGFVPAKGLRGCQEAYHEAIQRLIDLAPHRGPKAVVRILRDCIHEVNAIDKANHHFIETIAREELSEELDEIAYAAGLRAESSLALRWADW